VLDKINGLPAHVLLIHVVIVLLPLAALALVLSAAWPTARARLGFVSPALALIVLIFVPITTNAGEWLQNHLQGGVGQSPAIRHHAALGHDLLPWAIGIFVMAAAVWVLGRMYVLGWASTSSEITPRRQLPVWVTGVLTVLSLAVAIGGVVQLYRIGDSGAKAVWTGVAPG
jgi:hypothetical protein